MLVPRNIRSTLLALAAVVALCQVAARAPAPDFGLSADIDASRVELRLALFMVCLRVEATLPGHVATSARLFSCEGVCVRPRGRWS